METPAPQDYTVRKRTRRPSPDATKEVKSSEEESSPPHTELAIPLMHRLSIRQQMGPISFIPAQSALTEVVTSKLRTPPRALWKRAWSGPSKRIMRLMLYYRTINDADKTVGKAEEADEVLNLSRFACGRSF